MGGIEKATGETEKEERNDLRRALLRCRLCGHVHRGRMGTGTADVKRVLDRWAWKREGER